MMNCRFDLALERARDAMHLDWIARIEAGQTSGQIGKIYSVPSSHVRTVLNRIKADLAKSEEA